MQYKDELGVSFELPDTWSQNKIILQPTFHGPKYQGLIELEKGGIAPQFLDPISRERHLAEPDSTVSRTEVGGETNAVVLRRVGNSEISVVRDGIHYIILHSNDPLTQIAIELLKSSWKFPGASQAQDAIKRWSKPELQAVARALRASSPEEANNILTEAGIPGQRLSSGTVYDLKSRPTDPSERSHPEPGERPQRWWQFWKS